MDTLLSRTVATSATQHQSNEHCQDNHLVDGFYVTLELVGWPYPLLKCQVDTEDAGRKMQKNTTINQIYYTINKTMLPQRHNHRKLKMPLKVKKKKRNCTTTLFFPCFSFLLFWSSTSSSVLFWAKNLISNNNACRSNKNKYHADVSSLF